MVVLSEIISDALGGTEIVEAKARYVVPSAKRNSTVALYALVPSMLDTMISLIFCAEPVEGAATKALRAVSAGVIEAVWGVAEVQARIFGAAMIDP